MVKPILWIWKNLSTAATFYILYKQLESVSKAKDALYYDLSPEQRALYEQVFGKPGEKPTFPIPGFPMTPVSRPDQPSQINQVRTGV